MKPLKLLIETQLNEYEIIHEQENSSSPKFLKIRGPYIMTETKNNNGRIYGKKMMDKCISEYEKEFISTGRALGELNHPESCVINPDRICHRITKLYPDNTNSNIWIGESIVLEGTPMGNILKSILISGGRPGMSTRGVGDVTNEGIVSEYKLITVDAVLNPSIGQFIDGILESKQFMIDQHGDIIEMPLKNLEKNLASMPTNDKQTYVYNCLMNFIKEIK